jgi:hypothetical protein
MTEVPIEELLYRYEKVLPKYVELAKELADKLEQFGKYKEELQLITVEFDKRGFDPTIPDALVSFLQSEIDKRKTDAKDTTST